MLFNILDVILKMNAVASVTAVLVLAIKYILQKAGFSRKITIFLWLIIAYRLMCPIAIATDFSIFNLVPAEKAATQEVQVSVKADVLSGNAYIQEPKSESENSFAVLKTSVAVIWLAGMCLILLFGIISYLRLKKCLRFAIRLKNNIYTSEGIPTSFVFGILAPKIYISEKVTDENSDYIIAHEQTHIKRADHITKIIAYIFLSVYWFNPLSWVMFGLFSSDIEYACDESTIAKIGLENKKGYLNTLMTWSMNKNDSILLSCSPCFPASPTKKRIENMLKFKGNSKFLTLFGIAFCIMGFVVFGTNAMEHIEQKKSESFVNEYAVEKNTVAASPNKSINVQSIKAENKNSGSEGVEAKTADLSERQNCIEESVSFMQKDADISNIEHELKTNGASSVNDENVVSGINYAVKQYTFQNGCNGVLSNVTCNENGEVSLCFNINSESLVDVTFIDSRTKEAIDSFGILADAKSAYTFCGLDSDKTYDIIVNGKTGNDWKIEGNYIVY